MMRELAPLMDVDVNVAEYMIDPVNRLAAYDPISDPTPSNRDLFVCREVISNLWCGDGWGW